MWEDLGIFRKSASKKNVISLKLSFANSPKVTASPLDEKVQSASSAIKRNEYPLKYTSANKLMEYLNINKNNIDDFDVDVLENDKLKTFQWYSVRNKEVALEEDDAKLWRGYINVKPEFILDTVRIIIESNFERSFQLKFLLAIYDVFSGSFELPSAEDSHIIIYANTEKELMGYLENISMHPQWQEIEKIAAYPARTGLHPSSDQFKNSMVISYGQGYKERRDKRGKRSNEEGG